jgi:molybdopterin/thiamine biosynthesis adenylyltransferase
MSRPRVKPEHAAYRITGGRIRIGGISFGIAAEVADPTGSVWTLLRAMDGSRAPDEIVANVLKKHPGETEQSLRGAIETFVESGYIEDCGAPDPAELTDRDKERYARGRAYFRWLDLTPRSSTWAPQLRLRRARVTVVGLGGTGGNAAAALAASGVGSLHCVDRDWVELSNLNRQVLYSEGDIYRPKVQAAVKRLRDLNSDISITGEQAEVSSVADLAALASGCDALLLCADRPAEIYSWANRACLATKTPWVATGYHGPLVTVATYLPGDGACYQCLRMAQLENHRRIGARPDNAASRGEAVGNAVAAPSAGISGHLAAHAVLSLLTGVPPVAAGRVFSINLMALDEPFVFSGPRRADCADCGNQA